VLIFFAVTNIYHIFHDVAEFAYIAGIAIWKQYLYGVRRKTDNGFIQRFGEFLQKIIEEITYVAFSFPERRQMDMQDVKAIKKILAKGVVAHLLPERTVGRRNDPHIDGDLLLAASRTLACSFFSMLNGSFKRGLRRFSTLEIILFFKEFRGDIKGGFRTRPYPFPVYRGELFVFFENEPCRWLPLSWPKVLQYSPAYSCRQMLQAPCIDPCPSWYHGR